MSRSLRTGADLLCSLGGPLDRHLEPVYFYLRHNAVMFGCFSSQLRAHQTPWINYQARKCLGCPPLTERQQQEVTADSDNEGKNPISMGV